MSGTTLEQESGAESKKPANHESGVNRPTNRLYKNNRNGTLTDVTTKAGLLRTGWGQGVCVGIMTTTAPTTFSLPTGVRTCFITIIEME